MTSFNDYLNEVKQLLKNKYPSIDFENDWAVTNKLNDLAWIITRRLENPAPEKQGIETAYEPLPDWRRFY